MDHRKLLGDDRPTVGRFIQGLERLVLAIARNRYRFTSDAAEETLLEVVRKLWKDDKAALRAWRGEGSLEAYLAAIVHRSCLMERRRRRCRAVEKPGEFMDSFPAAAVPDALEAEERRRLCLEAAAVLSARDRKLLQMRFLDEMDYVALMKEMGLSYGAARKALHSAVRRLRERLQELAPDLFRPLRRPPDGNNQAAGASPPDGENPP